VHPKHRERNRKKSKMKHNPRLRMQSLGFRKMKVMKL